MLTNTNQCALQFKNGASFLSEAKPLASHHRSGPTTRAKYVPSGFNQGNKLLNEVSAQLVEKTWKRVESYMYLGLEY
jgi:hypothetical protein